MVHRNRATVVGWCSCRNWGSVGQGEEEEDALIFNFSHWFDDPWSRLPSGEVISLRVDA